MSEAPDVLTIQVGIGELCGLLAAALAVGVWLVLAENIRQGLVLAAPAGVVGYGVELGATLIAVGIGLLWAVLIGLVMQVVAARAAVWVLVRRRRRHQMEVGE